MKVIRYTIRNVQVVQRGPIQDGLYSIAIPSLNIVCIGPKEIVRENVERYINRPHLYKPPHRVFQIAAQVSGRFIGRGGR